MVREWDEAGHYTEHAVREQLLMGGDTMLNLILKYSHVQVNLKRKTIVFLIPYASIMKCYALYISYACKILNFD